jgi:hypothetical protein
MEEFRIPNQNLKTKIPQQRKHKYEDFYIQV